MLLKSQNTGHGWFHYNNICSLSALTAWPSETRTAPTGVVPDGLHTVCMCTAETDIAYNIVSTVTELLTLLPVMKYIHPTKCKSVYQCNRWCPSSWGISHCSTCLSLNVNHHYIKSPDPLCYPAQLGPSSGCVQAPVQVHTPATL